MATGRGNEVGFRELFEQNQVPEWRDEYMSYVEFRNKIRDYQEESDTGVLTHTQHVAFGQKMARKINYDLDHVFLFFLEQSGSLADNVSSTHAQAYTIGRKFVPRRIAALNASHLPGIRALHEEYIRIGEDIKRLSSYLEWNTRAIRKLIKKLTRATAHLGKEYAYTTNFTPLTSSPPESPGFWSNFLRFFKGSSLRSRQDATTDDATYSGGDESKWAPTAGAGALQHMECVTRDYVHILKGLSLSITTGMLKLDVAEEDICRRERASLSAQGGTSALPPTVSGIVTQDSSLRQRSVDMTKDLQARMSALDTRSTAFEKFIADQIGIFEGPSEDRLISKEEVTRILETPESNFIINLGSVFFYMVSCYCILPSAADYAVATGASKSWSGFLLAGAPLAGIGSSILFSYLASTGYKGPLLLSSVLCLIGNGIYAVAYTARSFPIAVLGRLFIGAGVARAVNRRYIADQTVEDTIVKRSVQFVAVSALGMAIGPLFGALFYKVAPRAILGLEFNSATYPSYFMFLLWLLYIVVLENFFVEPKRSDMPARNGIRRATGSGDNLISRRDATVEEGIPLLGNEGGNFAAARNSDSSTGLSNTLLNAVASDPMNAVEGMSITPAYGASGLASQREDNSNPPWANDRVRRRRGLAKKRPWRYVFTNPTIMLGFWMFFFVKFICDALLVALALYLPAVYGLSDVDVGLCILAMGGILVAVTDVFHEQKEKHHFTNGDLLQSLHLALVLGSMILLSTAGYCPRGLLAVSALTVFLSASLIEAILMPVQKELMPKSISRGTFNSSLLNSECGMLGRMVGDVAITLLSTGSPSVHTLIFRLFLLQLAFAILTLCAIGLIKPTFDQYLPDDEVDIPSPTPYSAAVDSDGEGDEVVANVDTDEIEDETEN